MHEVDERIRAARTALAEREHLSRVHAQLQVEIGNEEQRVAELGASLTEEQKDVKRYERGVWAFLYGLFRDREARLTKEQQEAAMAEAKYREAVASRDELREQNTTIGERLNALANAASDLAAARDAKRAMLKGTPTAEQIDGIAGEIGAHEAELKAIDEAITAGERAKVALLRLVEVLGSARNWGKADIWMDSMFVSWAKREKLDEARALAGAAQADLTMFQRELSDVGVMLDTVVLTAAEKGRFLDIWFDNIFSDMAAQDRIIEAQQTTNHALQEVSERVLQISQKRGALKTKVAALLESQNALVDPTA